MIVGFRIDRPEDVEQLRHLADCDYHYDEMADHLRDAIRKYIEKFDAGEIPNVRNMPGFAGIDIVEEAPAGGSRPENPTPPDFMTPDQVAQAEQMIGDLLGKFFSAMNMGDNPTLN